MCCKDGVERYCIEQFCAYVPAGSTREERAARLAEAPEEWRAAVAKHVEDVFKIRALARERARVKAAEARAAMLL